MVKYQNSKKGGSVCIYLRSERRDRLSAKIIILGRLKCMSRFKLTVFYCLSKNTEKIDYNESRIRRIVYIALAKEEKCHRIKKVEIRRIVWVKGICVSCNTYVSRCTYSIMNRARYLRPEIRFEKRGQENVRNAALNAIAREDSQRKEEVMSERRDQKIHNSEIITQTLDPCARRIFRRARNTSLSCTAL